MRHTRREEALWRRVYRSNALSDQGGKCAYCGDRLRFQEATADHVRPVVKNGGTNQQNIVACCRACNRTKGAMDKGKFRNAVRKPKAAHSIWIWRAHYRYRINQRVDLACRRIALFAGVEVMK